MRVPRLIAFDLDGTLLDPSCRLPPGHAETVTWLRERDIRVAIVTGRPLLTSRGVYRELELESPLVCFNGVWVGYPDQAPIAEAPLAEEEVRSVLAVLAERPGSICVYPGSERWIIHRFTERTRGWPELYGVPIEERPAVVDDWCGTSCKVMYVAEPPEIRAVELVLRDANGGRLHLSVSQPDRIEVIRAGVNKAVGLERLAGHLGIDAGETWAVGDAANDLEMLGWAGCGLAMGHAPAAVRSQADAVLPPIDEAGIASLREMLG